MMKWLTFSGSRHPTIYHACISSECSLNFIFCVQVIDAGHLITSGGDPQSIILCLLNASVVYVT